MLGFLLYIASAIHIQATQNCPNETLVDFVNFGKPHSYFIGMKYV